MKPDARNRVSDLYHRAASMAPADRHAFLRDACSGDDALRTEVESLLRCESEAAAFLEPPSDSVTTADLSRIDTRFGPYTILAPLGAGAMGTVYRARDSRLNREVALKILPAHVTADLERRVRFTREARVLAQLNHPHIGAIYGVEESEGMIALVLELVEGHTLAECLRRGRLPIQQALALAHQIAGALDAAHEKGIVHRDLKPANIVLQGTAGSDDVRIKVLDFGLAKLIADPFAERAEHTPASVAATEDGRILGTPAYMSPEQARGMPVDKRTDIWAFGCLLFEMLTGRRAFEGETVTDTFVQILEHEPDWSLVPASTPARVSVLLERCLRKSSRKRLHDIADAVLELEDCIQAQHSNGHLRLIVPDAQARAGDPLVGADGVEQLANPQAKDTGSGGRAGRARRVALVLSLTVIGVAAFLAGSFWKTMRAASPFTTRFSLGAPLMAGSWPRVSPDGRLIVYGVSLGARSQFWVRPLDSLSGYALAHGRAAETPFWSPDSMQLGFFEDGKLKTMRLDGGEPKVLADAPMPRGGAWSGDTILFGRDDGIYRVTSTGADIQRITAVDFDNGDDLHGWPAFLPDGRRFLFFVRAASEERRGLYVGSITGGPPKRLMHASSRAVYADGNLLYVSPVSSANSSREGVLVAHPFDANRAALRGGPVVLADRVRHHGSGDAAFDVSPTGVLAYQTVACHEPSRLTLHDPRGREVQTLTGAGCFARPRFAPDGRSIVADRVNPDDGNTDLWIFAISPPGARQLTTHPAPDIQAVWSPDGRHVAFSRRRKVWDVFIRSLDGGDDERLLLAAEGDKFVEDWSPDGRFWVGTRHHDGLWVVPLASSADTVQIRKGTTATHWHATFSPDGRWLAYMMAESGTPQIYVEPFPPTGDRWQISKGGGREPRWRADGAELVFLDADNMLASVSLGDTPWNPSAPERLFRVTVPGTVNSNYSISPDGSLFVVNTAVRETIVPPIAVLMDWRTLIDR